MLLRILAGPCLAGASRDCLVLLASVRSAVTSHNFRSEDSGINLSTKRQAPFKPHSRVGSVAPDRRLTIGISAVVVVAKTFSVSVFTCEKSMILWIVAVPSLTRIPGGGLVLEAPVIGSIST